MEEANANTAVGGGITVTKLESGTVLGTSNQAECQSVPQWICFNTLLNGTRRGGVLMYLTIRE